MLERQEKTIKTDKNIEKRNALTLKGGELCEYYKQGCKKSPFISNMDIKINLAGLIIEIEGFPYKDVPENMVPFICDNEMENCEDDQEDY